MISKQHISTFISQKYPEIKDSSYIRLDNTLEKVIAYEEVLEKPFEQMTQAELIKMFEDNNWTAINTFISNKSVVKEFAGWYFQTVIGLANIPFGHPKVSPVEHIELQDVSSDFRYHREYYKDANDFFECMEEMFGSITEDRWVMNKVLFTLMWEGLDRPEIRHLKMDDVAIKDDKLVLRLSAKDILVSEERSIKIIKQAISVDGYDIETKTGKTRSFEYAKTGMVLRNTSKRMVTTHQAIAESSLNKYCLEQVQIADELPESNKYHGKHMVYRGISDSAAFVRLLDMGIQEDLDPRDIAKAKRLNYVSEGVTRSFEANFKGWKEYFGH